MMFRTLINLCQGGADRRGRGALGRALASTLAGLTLIATGGGCLRPKDGRPGGLFASRESPPTTTTAAATTTTSDRESRQEAPTETAADASLTAIEDFLRRTSQYRVAADTDSGGTSGAASPAALQQGASKRPAESANSQPLAWEQAGPTGPAVAVDRLPPEKPAMPIPALVAVSINTPVLTDDDVADAPVDKTTNQAMDVNANARHRSLDALLEPLVAQAKENNDFESQWRLRLAQLAGGRDEDATAADDGLSEQPSRLLADLIATAIAVRDAVADPLLTGETALAKVEDLRDALADRADPRVATIALCRKVSTFGDYEEMSPTEFVSGRVLPTIVYSQIKHLRAQRNAEDRFETRLSTRIEVYSDAGEVVWQREEPEIVDTCRRRRTDFFIAQRVSLPATLAPGKYVLKVLVEDKLASRATEATHEFDIYAPISVARGK